MANRGFATKGFVKCEDIGDVNKKVYEWQKYNRVLLPVKNYLHK
jgi:hypothetical protein